MLRESQRRLAADAPVDPPRASASARPTPISASTSITRCDVGSYNPFFPDYELRAEGSAARGTVSFPVCYEGPPGIVHGGFLAVFFDCVLQQLNCDLGLAGKTAELSLRFRRPTPLLTPLVVHAERSIEGSRIRSRAELLLDDKVLCEAEMQAAAAGNRDALPTVSPRRP